MGIRGLTTFIARNFSKYVDSYELHDSYVVIDGNAIACCLYRQQANTNDCFGGDYDKFGKTLVEFFKSLHDCRVIPLVVVDGGYEHKKLKTVYKRIRANVSCARRLNSVTSGSIGLFPLFLRDVFVDMVIGLGVKLVRCDFEADTEIANLAMTLGCPVISNDSDFYIFGVLYVPFDTLEMGTSGKGKDGIKCKIYKIDNFLKQFGGLNKEVLPLMAVLLGNDYISKKVFNAFYSQMKLKKNKGVTDQQRRIATIIAWLQSETLESALRKILSRCKARERRMIKWKIKRAGCGYICREIHISDYFDVDVDVKGTINDQLESIMDKYEKDEEDMNRENEEEEQESEVSQSSDEEDSETSDNELIENLLNSGNETDASKFLSGFPQWFVENYRRGQYPASFIDMLNLNSYFVTPQIENFQLDSSSHLISLKIISAIRTILTSNNRDSPNLNCLINCKRIPVQKCSDKDLPTLSTVTTLSEKEKKLTILKVLELDSSILSFVSKLPASWQLYFVAIIFWARTPSSGIPATYAHIYSLVLCCIILNKIDILVGFYRTGAKFESKFRTKLTAILERKKPSKVIDETTTIASVLNVISYEDAVLGLKPLITYFEMDPKMKGNVKLHDMDITHAFAEFQSSFLHVKYLNSCLNRPFQDVPVSSFYNGTFLYNMTSNLLKRTDRDLYLKNILKNSNVYEVLVFIINRMKKMLVFIETGTNTGPKRRKKKKKCPVVPDGVLPDCIDQSDSDDFADVNNRFFLLKLLD